jgi:hypothetical protein
MIKKLKVDSADSICAGPPQPSKNGDPNPVANIQDDRPDVGPASEEELNQSDQLFKNLVDGNVEHEIHRQRFSLPHIQLVHDAFIAFYEELGVSNLSVSELMFCTHAFRYRCQKTR